jgi:hypothetical protein
VSSPLALAAVTATLCDLLNNGLINNDLAAVGSFSVTALPPDRIETGNNEANRLNLFLYQVTSNAGWRNEGLPYHDSRTPTTRLSNPPLPLDLHYMLTAYGSATFAAEILLGYAMELLHSLPVLTRANIREALAPTNPISVTLVPPDPQGRKAIDLADQIEMIKITPHYLSAEELSRLWTSMQARYRPTMVYQVSTVLIQGVRPRRSPLPVLARGDRDRGVKSQASIGAPPPARPTLAALRVMPAVATDVRDGVELGDTLELSGALLAGGTVTAEFRHPLLTTPIVRAVEPGPTSERVRVVVPQSHDPLLPTFLAAADSNWPAGFYTVALRIDRAGKPAHLTNEMPFTLAPRVPQVPTVSGTAVNPQIALTFFPELWPGQRAAVYVGGDPFVVAPVGAKTGTLTLSIKGFTPADTEVPVTLRVDGVDSQIVRDRSLEPPQFDPKQRVSLPV